MSYSIHDFLEDNEPFDDPFDYMDEMGANERDREEYNYKFGSDRL